MALVHEYGQGLSDRANEGWGSCLPQRPTMLNVRVVAVGAVGSTALAPPSVDHPERNPVACFDRTLAEFAVDAPVRKREQFRDARHTCAADATARAHAAAVEIEAVLSFSARLVFGITHPIPLWPLKACAAYEEAEHSMEPFPLQGSDENEVSSHSTRRAPHVPKDCLLAHALVSAATGLAN